MESMQSGTLKFLIATLVVLSFTLVSVNLPASPEYVMAATLLTQKKYSDAIPHLDRSIQSEPNRVLAYVLRASGYNSIGEYDKAMEDCNKAIALNQHEPRAWTKRAFAHIGLERYSDAVEDCDQAIGSIRNSHKHTNTVRKLIKN
jgi:tetratricopeptide (TPR) repeat protein